MLCLGLVGAPAAATELGSPTAAIVVEEFSDYRCPYCRVYASRSFPAFAEEYVTSGRVRYVARDLPLLRNSTGWTRIAEAARCAGEQGRFWAMRRELFDRRASDSVDALSKHAVAAGAERAEFEACLKDGTYVHAVREDVAHAKQLGVTATPTFVVVRRDEAGRVTHRRVVTGGDGGRLKRVVEEMIAVAR
jgi:protein-disulfide isomerase